MNFEKSIGIWIDLREAIIASGNEIIDVVTSNFTLGHAKGGSGSATPYGPQDVISESKVLEKKKHSLNMYFADILDRIEDFENVVIMGPGLTKQQLCEQIKRSHKTKHISVTLVTADKITHNQLKAKVREALPSDKK